MAKSVSLAKLQELLESGDWIMDSKATEAINEYRSAVVEELKSADKTGGQIVYDPDKDEKFYECLPATMQEKIEHVFFYPGGGSFFSHDLRIMQHTVFKITPSIRDFVFKGLGLISAVLLFTKLFDFLSLIKIVTSLRELINVLFSAWERLGDPEEQVVFETIFKLQGKLSTEYEARRNFLPMPRSLIPTIEDISPTINDIEREIGPKLSSEDIQKTLVNLKKRGILQESNGKWRIQL